MTTIGSLLRGYCGDPREQPASRLSPEFEAKLPADTGRAAAVPAGVRLELTGTARAIEADITVAEADRPAAPTMAPAFSVWLGDERVEQVAVGTSDTAITLPLPDRDDEQRVIVYLPESPAVTIRDLRPIGGTVEPAPRGPRWLAYGDSILQGWSVTDPGRSWASTVARRTGLDLVNLGFAGSARGELPAALQLQAAGPADVLTLAWGTNCWSSIPFDAGLLREQVRLFLTCVRQGHPEAPLVVVSPIVRPAAESQPNPFGATLADLRQAMEETVLACKERWGDEQLRLVPGADVVSVEDLVDGVHPGDRGHAAMAARLLEAIEQCGVPVRTGRPG